MNSSRTILLVDDSENDLMLMRIAFERTGVGSSLHEVSNGEEAIAYLGGAGVYKDGRKYPLPAVMLLDLKMPKKDGFEVLQWVRTQNGLRCLAIIVLTASIRAEDIARAFDLGANSFLMKPRTMDELTDLIRCLEGMAAA